ncbi:MAG TPA: alpha/beta hydrolase [Thermoleophilaceae bacterium]
MSPLREINGVRLLVEESGSGPALVLVHGSWDDRRSWGRIENELSRRYRVVSYDRRGHTGSDDGYPAGTRRTDEDDLAEIIEALGLAPAHVVASSFGGSISLGLAARRPELVQTVCAHEPPLLSIAADDPEVARVFETMRSLLELIDRGEREAAARGFADDIALGRGSWAMIPTDVRASMVANAETAAGEVRDPEWAQLDLDGLSRAGVPLLVTQGNTSPLFFRRIIERLAAAVEGAEVRTLPGAGHLPHLTHPAEYVAAVRGFIERSA